MQDSLAALLARTAPQASTATQAQIIQAALELFAEHGYDATTTLAIARRAGVTEKTLFRHFGSKQQLFARTVYPAILRLVQPLLFENLRAVLAEERRSLRETLSAIIMERVRFAREHPAILKLIAQELLLHREFREPFVEFWQSQLLAGIRAVLRHARERGQLRDLPDAAVLRALISLTVGYALNRTLLDPEADWDDEAEVRVLVDVLLNGLGARTG